jgi:hypothetical protein
VIHDKFLWLVTENNRDEASRVELATEAMKLIILILLVKDEPFETNTFSLRSSNIFVETKLFHGEYLVWLVLQSGSDFTTIFKKTNISELEELTGIKLDYSLVRFKDLYCFQKFVSKLEQWQNKILSRIKADYILSDRATNGYKRIAGRNELSQYLKKTNCTLDDLGLSSEMISEIGLRNSQQELEYLRNKVIQLERELAGTRYSFLAK